MAKLLPIVEATQLQIAVKTKVKAQSICMNKLWNFNAELLNAKFVFDGRKGGFWYGFFLENKCSHENKCKLSNRKFHPVIKVSHYLLGQQNAVAYFPHCLPYSRQFPVNAETAPESSSSWLSKCRIKRSMDEDTIAFIKTDLVWREVTESHKDRQTGWIIDSMNNSWKWHICRSFPVTFMSRLQLRFKAFVNVRISKKGQNKLSFEPNKSVWINCEATMVIFVVLKNSHKKFQTANCAGKSDSLQLRFRWLSRMFSLAFKLCIRNCSETDSEISAKSGLQSGWRLNRDDSQSVIPGID